MVQFPFHIGVKQRLVALASAPEHIARSAEVLGDLHCFLDLAGGIGKDLRRGVRPRSRHKPPVAERIARTPEQFNASIVLEFLGVLGDFVQPFIGFGKRVGFGGNVPVVEAPETHAQLGKKLKRRVHCLLSNGHRIVRGIVIPQHGRPSERVGAEALEGVPVADRKPKMLSHGLAQEFLFGIVMLKRQGVLRIRAFVFNLFDFREIAFHSVLRFMVAFIFILQFRDGC